MFKIHFNRQKLQNLFWNITIFILLLGAIQLLQVIQTTLVFMSKYKIYLNSLCYISSYCWVGRIITLTITTLLYDLTFSFLSQKANQSKKDLLRIKIIILSIFIIYIILLCIQQSEILLTIITTNLFSIHLCQLHKIFYSNSIWIMKGIINLAFLILSIPSSYLCMFYQAQISLGQSFLYGMIGTYISVIIILVVLSLKTSRLDKITLTNENGDHSCQLLLLDNSYSNLKTKQQKYSKLVLIFYCLLFQFLSIYLNNNAILIQEAYLQYNMSLIAQIAVYFIVLLFFYPFIRIITIEDGVNILISINILLLGINIIVENNYYSLGFFSFTYSMLAGGISLILPMMISELYKSFYNLFSEDYYIRLGLGFYFMCFFLQNYQFKRMYNVTPYYFFYEPQFLNSELRGIKYSLKRNTPSIYIGFIKKQTIKRYNQNQMQYASKYEQQF
ncbi:transmembrane protein, putative (macronuclear) [Tetrahymena thermophila SB210]|uniref:Transmembrane protein, putative n=1 Tax=Tetrahymena thermophila (strain SB210) TaxID=312017 RepID=Q23D43_TETTS|nr:transmembrane protein, putative [Tetrahymena thermophila SB210]EAR94360.2 transmembrane protein, putative [Tetrahymena thermophila SB210]|eukprot:XP_001014843.2 transmembrane protein, putative [Tetrahymena thermophila SB210]